MRDFETWTVIKEGKGEMEANKRQENSEGVHQEVKSRSDGRRSY